jgi:hypothetical protein
MRTLKGDLFGSPSVSIRKTVTRRITDSLARITTAENQTQGEPPHGELNGVAAAMAIMQDGHMPRQISVNRSPNSSGQPRIELKRCPIKGIVKFLAA